MARIPDIRPAKPEEADFLSELAIRSKAYWGYPQDFMEACRAELSVSADELRADTLEFAVAEDDGVIVGFYAVETLADSAYELDALFVEPGRIGTGVGRLLMQHAVDAIRAKGGGTMLIQGDPHATDFYTAAGARPIGSRESDSIPGRLLPLFELQVPRAPQ